MLWSNRDSRALRAPATALSSTSQKASPSNGSVAPRIDNPNSSLAASAPVATSSRYPLSPLDPQLTASSSLLSKTLAYNAPPSPSSPRTRVQPCDTDMGSIQIARRITNNFGDDAAPMPAGRRSISDQCVSYVSCCAPTRLSNSLPDKTSFPATRVSRQGNRLECRTATLLQVR